MQTLTLRIKKERTGPILGRHPWVFSQAIEHIPEGIASGTPVRLIEPSGRYLASGYFNSYSQIAVRIWGYEEAEEIDKDFFLKRILRAARIRQSYLEVELTDSYRLINSENDLIPGLVVDKYSDYLVIQCHTSGIELWLPQIIDALIEGLRPKGIYERSDLPSKKTGKRALLYGDVPDIIEIKENALRFLVDIKRGQKTGFFLDQRDKRKALLRYSKGRRVLNCFSYTGGFSVYALKGGAKSAICVDTSKEALELARENIKINGIDPDLCEYVEGDVKKYLRGLREGEFDLIVLDPPAFIKERKKKQEGLIGYKNINESAMRVLPEDGILLTCSCSLYLNQEEFRYILSESAGRVGKTIQILQRYTHGIDHPELVAFTESQYLKCFILSVVG